MLRIIRCFERASAPQLLALTSATVEVPLAEGASLFRAGDMPAVYVMMSRGGRASSTRQQARSLAPPGAMLGVAETLAGLGAGWRATVTARGTPFASTASRCSMCSATTLT